MIVTLLHYYNFRVIELYHRARFQKVTRYYTIELQKDLLGDWTVVISNGRLKSRLGRTRLIAFKNFPAAFNQFCLLCELRHHRGYFLTSYESDNLLFHLIIASASFESKQIEIKRKKPRKEASNLIEQQQMSLFF